MAESKAETVEVGDSRPVVVVSYGLSTQIELGAKDSPWHNASVTFSIPLDEGQDPQDTADTWMAQAKGFVLSELAVEATLGDDGIVQPAIEMPKKSTAKRATTRSAPSPDASLPTIELNGETWIDYRSEKEAGRKPERFPDFKTPDNKKSEWVKDKDGNVKEEFAEYA